MSPRTAGGSRGTPPVLTGLTWDKPQLGLHEYRGSTANNIVVNGYGPVLKDPSEPDPAKRYKMIKRGPTPREVATKLGARANYSPDGIHWTEGPRIRVSGMGRPQAGLRRSAAR